MNGPPQSGGRRAARRRGKPRRGPLLAAGAVAVAAAVTLTVVLWPDGDTPDEAGTGRPSGTKSTDSGPPASSYPVSKAPRTLPAVTEHRAARGPGWRPDGGRVVVADPQLADEAKLLASELKLSYGSDAKPRKGDVLLDVDSGKRGGAESYTLAVRGEQVRITAPDQAGVFYGTRTLKQAVHADGKAPEGVVEDRPAKPQRGFMLDIARKSFDADWIEDRIRQLGDLKYNQLGLHFSDDQSFRIASTSHPEVVSKDHLTKGQVRRILDLAAERHITVVPEIDSPGHLGAVIRAHPELQLRNTSGTAARGAVDISKPAAAEIVDDLLREYAQLFRGRYWHLGADEYQALMAPDPEASYPQLAAAARERYGANARVQDLATGWLNDRAKTMRPFDRTLKAWNDGLFRGGVVQPPDDLEISYWTGKEIGAREPVEYLKEGRDVLNLNDEYLYYVLGQPNEFVYPTGERIYKEWTPRVLRGDRPVPASYDDQILGGSFAVWCDLADAQTQDQVAAGIRMPLRATAEKLWTEGEPKLSWEQFEKLSQDVG